MLKKRITKVTKKYRFITDLFLLKDGQLIERIFHEDKKKRGTYIIQDHAGAMETIANKTITFEKGVILQTFLELVAPYASQFNAICSGWLTPLLKEYNNDKKKGFKKRKGIKYLEVFKTADLSLHQNHTSDLTKQNANLGYYARFHGIGSKKDKDGWQDRYVFSYSPIIEIVHLPLQINNYLDRGLRFTHSPCSGKISFEKNDDGTFNMVSEYEDKNKHFQRFYNIKEIISDFLSKKLKAKVPFPEKIEVPFTFAEVLRAIVEDMTFHGLGKTRKDFCLEIDRRISKIKKSRPKKKNEDN